MTKKVSLTHLISLSDGEIAEPLALVLVLVLVLVLELVLVGTNMVVNRDQLPKCPVIFQISCSAAACSQGRTRNHKEQIQRKNTSKPVSSSFWGAFAALYLLSGWQLLVIRNNPSETNVAP